MEPILDRIRSSKNALWKHRLPQKFMEPRIFELSKILDTTKANICIFHLIEPEAV